MGKNGKLWCRALPRILASVLILFSSVARAMTTDGNKIINSKGEAITLKGISWFGFNNQGTMVDGLWGGSDSLSFDFATQVYRLQLLGFNAIRLPFSFKDLYNLSPRNFANNCTLSTAAQIQANVTDPSVSVPPGTPFPSMVFPATYTNGVCNSYLPNDTVLNRFLFVVGFFARNGFYVLLDNHLREDQTALTNPNLWVQKWADLMTAVTNDPISADRVMVDILNEPDNFNVRWEAANGNPSLKDLYLSVMDVVYPINPKALFLVEGTGQGGIQANWGDGFATDPQLIASQGLSDPNPFFTTLLTKPYLNQVVISPHVYPPSVTGGAGGMGQALWNRLTASFGTLTQAGYCGSGGKCKVFPVAIGEFGSRFTETNDVTWMGQFASYLNNQGGAADGKHQAIPNYFYWAWNANSGDTGGIVDDSWRNIVWGKVEYLSQKLGLLPWYMRAGPNPVPTSSPSPTPSPSPTVVPTPVPSVTPSPTPPPSPTPSPSPTVVPSPTPSPSPTGTPLPPPTAGACRVEIQTGAPWENPWGSGRYSSVLNLFVYNLGASPINTPWVLTLTNPNYLKVEGTWNWVVNSVAGGTISGVAKESWESLVPNVPINVGLIVTFATKDFLPQVTTVNGVSCQISFR